MAPASGSAFIRQWYSGILPKAFGRILFFLLLRLLQLFCLSLLFSPYDCSLSLSFIIRIHFSVFFQINGSHQKCFPWLDIIWQPEGLGSKKRLAVFAKDHAYRFSIRHAASPTNSAKPFDQNSRYGFQRLDNTICVIFHGLNPCTYDLSKVIQKRL